MGLAVIWILASLIGAGVALTYLFSLNIERTTRDDLEAALLRLAAVIVPSTDGPTISTPLPDPRYATPFGGRYWQVEARDGGEIARSRSLWDFVLDVSDQDGTYNVAGPDERELLILTRDLQIEGEAGAQTFKVTVGIDNAPIRAASERFVRDLLQVLLLLGAIIVIAAWIQIRLGLSPILRVRKSIESVRRGNQTRLDGAFPSELQPLVQEVNSLIEVRDQMMDRARARAADLAHGLKTPLAAIHGIAERVRDQGGEAEADMLQQLTFEMSERVDYQMRLAALRVRTSAHTSRSSLNTALLRTLTVLKKTAEGEHLHWIAELGEDCNVDIHRQDLMELVGVTLENAAKWAASRIIVRSRHAGGSAVLEVCDDGPGIPEDKLASLGVRGTRLDQTLPGSGLGLAIASEILAINGGTMAFSRAQIGGLIVTITLPLSRDAE